MAFAFRPSVKAATSRLLLRPRTTNLIPSRRTMTSVNPQPPISTPPAGKYEWLVVVPDKPGAHQKRLEVRPKHLEGLKPFQDSGTFKVGGAVLNEKPEVEDPTKFDFYGSTLVMVAESKDEVVQTLKADIYATSGVWDVDKAQIWPVKLAFRYP